MKLRSDVVASIRKRMWALEFREFQTPIITASSPEGARDFLVPSRLHPGKFYALPQAPQQFKQLLMVSGFDKYFQIAPCFRDEDPRADRSPTDFYQLDVEMSFVEQEDVFRTIQPVIQGVFEEFGGNKVVDVSWEKIPFKTSMILYGTDKPDLRNPLKMQIVSEHFQDSGFEIFSKILKQEGTEIRAIPAPSGGSRKFCDRMNSFAQKEGLPGMGYIFWREVEGVVEAAGPLAKNIGAERTEAIRVQLNLGVGDAAFFLAGKPTSFEAVAGRARVTIGNELNLVDNNRFAFAWIVDFPMYEKDIETRKVDLVAEKEPISKNATVGVYYWKHGHDYVRYADQMIEKNTRVNNEFYVCPVYNEAVADSKKILIKEIDKSFTVIAAALSNLGKLLIISSKSINTPYYI